MADIYSYYCVWQPRRIHTSVQKTSVDRSRKHGKEHTDTSVSAAYNMINGVNMYFCTCPLCCSDFNIIDDTTLYCYELCVCTYFII